MKQLLDVLRSGEAQQVLFQPDLPIEAALEELFKRPAAAARAGSGCSITASTC